MATCTRCGASFGFFTGTNGLCNDCREQMIVFEAAAAEHISDETPAKEDDISVLLKNGWTVAGYSIASFTTGTITHSVLLQREHELTVVTFNKFGGKEIGVRTVQKVTDGNR